MSSSFPMVVAINVEVFASCGLLPRGFGNPFLKRNNCKKSVIQSSTRYLL